MQSLEIISVNLWQTVISLCNLLVLFLILKFVLYKPIKKVLAQRENELKNKFDSADNAKRDAEMLKQEWEAKISDADSKADGILRLATENAEKRKKDILDETKAQADRMIRKAETDAELERMKAQAEMKKEIVDISTVLSEKLLEREINADDHRKLIDSFIDEIGDDNDRDE